MMLIEDGMLFRPAISYFTGIFRYARIKRSGRRWMILFQPGPDPFAHAYIGLWLYHQQRPVGFVEGITPGVVSRMPPGIEVERQFTHFPKPGSLPLVYQPGTKRAIFAVLSDLLSHVVEVASGMLLTLCAETAVRWYERYAFRYRDRIKDFTDNYAPLDH
jgi:hypothetical protein